MCQFNFSFLLVLIGSWMLKTEVQCKSEDQAIVVQEMKLLGTIQELPEDVKNAVGDNTSGYDAAQRTNICGQLNTKHVVDQVKVFFGLSDNALSAADPGDTKVYRIISNENSSRGMLVLGFVCKAAEGSYSFVLVRKPKIGWAAYVPRVQPVPE